MQKVPCPLIMSGGWLVDSLLIAHTDTTGDANKHVHAYTELAQTQHCCQSVAAVILPQLQLQPYQHLQVYHASLNYYRYGLKDAQLAARC